jgi:hypothetical protein
MEGELRNGFYRKGNLFSGYDFAGIGRGCIGFDWDSFTL